MEIQDINGCCAVQEICHLSDHDNAEAAMKELIEGYTYDGAVDYYTGRKLDGCLEKLPGFFLFSEVSSTTYDNVSDNNRVKKGYGKKFALYIKKHNLGKVSISAAARNHQNHPQHFVKVYTWAPSQKGVKTWAKKMGLL